jgi:hypothetical protein
MFGDEICSRKKCHTYKCFDIDPCQDGDTGYDIWLFEEYVGWEATLKEAKKRIREYQAGSYYRINFNLKFYKWAIDAS